MAATVRIEQATHRALAEVARAKGITMQAALTCAVEAYRRQVFLEGLAEDFARLRADRRAWTQEQKERHTWDQSLKDGAEKK
jgi:glutaminase